MKQGQDRAACRASVGACGCPGEELGCSPALGVSLGARGQHSAQHVCASPDPGTCHVEGMEEPKNPNFTIKISIISKHPCDADPSPPCLVFSHGLELAAGTGKWCWNLSCRPIKALYLQASSPRAGRAASRGKARSCLLLSIASLGHRAEPAPRGQIPHTPHSAEHSGVPSD